MQTFLPYPDFVESARVLDPPRLGKQRVEALQVLRGIAFPSYGWQRHPAMQMWRGYTPALTRYALDMVDAWTERGHADSIRPLIAEFAPHVDGAEMSTLSVPSWLGDEALHLSHQSNLLRKDLEFYRPFFPDVPDDLPYVWPGSDPEVDVRELAGRPLWVVRAANDEQVAQWVEAGGVAIRGTSPRGKSSPNWRAQLAAFAELEEGSSVAILVGNGSLLHVGTVEGSVAPDPDDESSLWRRVAFSGELFRDDFPYPALLQDPRAFFATVGPS